MTSQEPAEWYIFLSKENPDAFTYVISKNVLELTSPRFLSIQLVTTALDVDLYVGTNDANLVVISIPVVAHPEQDILQWKFLARNDGWSESMQYCGCRKIPQSSNSTTRPFIDL